MVEYVQPSSGILEKLSKGLNEPSALALNEAINARRAGLILAVQKGADSSLTWHSTNIQRMTHLKSEWGTIVLCR